MNVAAKTAVVAVDWGTSSFRLWALDRAGKTLVEHRGDQGMSRLAPDGFEPVLTGVLQQLEIATEVPVVICGMAGAAQGWCEARYLKLPAALDRLGDHAIRVPHATRDIRILPGLSQSQPGADVMRGEETQLAGAIATTGRRDGLFCIPGTHSKWVWLDKGTVTRFATIMTGEMFELLSQKSTLSGAVRDGDASESAPEFSAAVRTVLGAPETAIQQLFSVRSIPLVHGAKGGNMAARLSGLLIGAELALVRDHAGVGVTLIASGGLAQSYEKALEIAGFEFDVVDAEALTRHGLLAAAASIWPDRLNVKGTSDDS